MSKNPFTYGGPINNPDRFVGRGDELNQILNRLRASSATSIVGERRIGRTSLLKMLPIQELGFRTHFIYLDLQMIKSKHTPLDFWQQVLRRLSHSVLDDELKAMIKELRSGEDIDGFDLGDLFDELEKAGQSVVLLLDELERLANNPNFDPEFFYELRALTLNHRLALVTTSQTELDNLSLSDPKSGASPFFNIFGIVYLGSFKPKEVEQFFDHYLAGTGIEFTTFERDFLRTIAGLHPYYLTVGGRLLFDAHLNLPLLRLADVKPRFSAEVKGALRYSWSHTEKVEKNYLTILALLTLKEGAETPVRFSRKKLTTYYYTTSSVLEGLIRRGLVIEEEGDVSIFSIVFAEWIRDELRDKQPDVMAVNAWLNEPATQNSLQYIKKSVIEEVTARLLPVIKPRYRGWMLTWLINARNVKPLVELLLLLAEESDRDQYREGVKPLIMTEGKTDWKHLKAALKKLQEAGHYADLEIEFSEYEDELQMGSGELRNLCQHSSKIFQSRPILCIFDRDEAKIIKQVADKKRAYKDWGNNVFSFIIPLPDHRVATPNISIEFYYTDSEIKRLDKQGRRLFLSDEFHPSSRHKSQDLTCTDLSKIKRKDVSIIDDRVFDGHHKNVALPKSQFADYINQQEEGFNDFNVSEFQKIFDIIVMIIQDNGLA